MFAQEEVMAKPIKMPNGNTQRPSLQFALSYLVLESCRVDRIDGGLAYTGLAFALFRSVR